MSMGTLNTPIQANLIAFQMQVTATRLSQPGPPLSITEVVMAAANRYVGTSIRAAGNAHLRPSRERSRPSRMFVGAYARR